MLRRSIPVVLLLSATFIATAAVSATRSVQAPVVVHEWGTFTTVAGEDGQAVNWLPLGGPTDLPCFVEHFGSRDFKVLPIALNPEGDAPLDYAAARSSLVGTVRMETPVLYFYADNDAQVSVSVKFPRGLMTEWYPTAMVAQPLVVPTVLNSPSVFSAITWPAVHVRPGRQPSYPRGNGQSHYYAARATDAAPLLVNGQEEKFLFYRGVASFPQVLSARLDADGSVALTNLGTRPIPAIVYFENRAGQLSYRVGGSLATTAKVNRPSSPASFAALKTDLEKMLTDVGMFKREAEAMVETWRDSWFEEGARIFYVVPPATVDDILPLTVTPAPAKVARAFVGRMELVTPDSLVRVQTAIASGDTAAVERYGRFLGPISDRLVARMTSVSDRSTLRAMSNAIFTAYVRRVGTCQ